ncbi:MAG: hypothetical protein KJ044_13590, partial [Planctomycetes bacterium]|nr:hypothetical protein [Planctomycetota bacterium]
KVEERELQRISAYFAAPQFEKLPRWSATFEEARARNKDFANWVRTNLVPNLVDTINSTDRVDAPLVKAAAARALGACYQYHRGSFDEDGFKALLALVRLEHDLDSIGDENTRMRAIAEVNAARNAAGDALGRAPTTQAQRALIARAQMIVPHAKPPAIPKSE